MAALSTLALARLAVAASGDDPEGSCLTVGNVLRLLDVSGSRNRHLANSLNYPGRGFSPRPEPLKGTEVVSGAFLLLTYCAHDPFVRLSDFDDLEALERALTSNGGIVNRFITYAVAFVDGAPKPYGVTYRAATGDLQEFDKWAQNRDGPQAAEKAADRWVVWK